MWSLRKKYLATALVLNFILLFYFVWTPGTAVNCTSSVEFSDKVFCQGPIFSLIGNFLLLFPTLLLSSLLLPQITALVLACNILMLALLIEIVQIFIPGRDASFVDVLVNVFGALLIYQSIIHYGLLERIRDRLHA